MKYYDTIEELVEEYKSNFQMLIKFGTKDNLESLREGLLYMKNLKYYNELEVKNGSGKPDRYDGKWAMREFSFTLADPHTLQPVLKGNAKRMILSFGYEKNPVFCMFSYDRRNCGDYRVNDESNSIQISTHFTEEQKEKLKSGLGEYALIISDTNAFLEKIRKAFLRENLQFILRRVVYNTGNSVERANSIFSDINNIAFNKDVNDFSYQQEIRILITNRQVDDHLAVDIGNVEEITKLITTDELLNFNIELNQQYERIN